MPEPHKHADKRNFVESILRYIPGFRGYLEKEYRRESDYLTRKWMAERLRDSKRPLDNYQRALLDSGQIDALPSVDRVRVRLDTLERKLLAEMRGHSGFFDFVRVTEQTLDAVYAHDMALVEEADHLAASIEQLAAKSDTPASVVGDLLARIDQFEARLQRRGQLLEGTAEEQ